jgi:hypothetical protein
MRLHVEAWLLTVVVLGVAGYLIVTRTLQYRRFMNECSELGIDRMVESPSDDDVRHMVDDCKRGRRRR